MGSERKTGSRESQVYNRWVAALNPGSALPTIALRDGRGNAVALPAGETLYGFFKTTCPTSELAWPYLERIRVISEGGKLSVLAVSQDDAETTERFNERLGVRVRTLYDPSPWRASEALGLESVPTLFLIGAAGTIRESIVGFQRQRMEELASIAAALAGRPSPGLFRPGENVPSIKPG